jgi:hypothetical protein
MNPEHPDTPWTDAAFSRNQRNFPAEELLRYAGQHIAWSWDGARILAGAPDRRTLDAQLRAAGVDPSCVIHDFVEDPGVSYLV